MKRIINNKPNIFAITVIILIMVFAILTSCKTSKSIETSNEHVEIRYKNDTVFISSIDTIIVSKIDTIHDYIENYEVRVITLDINGDTLKDYKNIFRLEKQKEKSNEAINKSSSNTHNKVSINNDSISSISSEKKKIKKQTYFNFNTIFLIILLIGCSFIISKFVKR